MPYTLKPNKLFVKDPNGDGYLPQNVVTDRTTADMVQTINTAGAAQQAALEARSQEIIQDWPDTDSELTEEVRDLKSALSESSGIEAISLTPSYYIATASSPVNLTPTYSASFANGGYAVVDCSEGDRFVINGTGGYTSRLWCFINTNDNNKILLNANVNVTENNLVIEAPSNATKLIINSTTKKVCTKYVTPKLEINNINDEINVGIGFEKINIWANGYIATSGSTVDIDQIEQGGTPSKCVVVNCNEGDKFTITGSGGVTWRLWAFISNSESNNRLTVADTNASETLKTITAPANAAYLVVNVKSELEYVLYKGQTIVSQISKINDDIADMEEDIAENSDGIDSIDKFVKSDEKVLGLEPITGWVSGRCIKNDTSNIADAVANPVTSLSYMYCIVECEEGDRFLINANSGTIPKAYTFTDASYNVLSGFYGSIANNRVAVAPPTSKYLVINRNTANKLESYYGIPNLSLDYSKNNLNINLTEKENMIWTYWNYPQIISFKKVRDKVYWGYTTADGYSGIAEYDFASQKVKKTHLKKNHVDDHNAAAVYVFADGTIICGYSSGHNIDNNINFRRSEIPECIDSFDDVTTVECSGVTCYCQFIEYNSTLYAFYRVGDKSWCYRYSSDKGKTWSAETIVTYSTVKYYCKFTETTTPGRVRIIMYPNPGTELEAVIRQGFVDLSTGKIYDGDGTTELGTSSVPYTSFTVLIPIASGYAKNRLYDVAISDANRPMILYAPLYSTNDSTEYRIYDNGNITTVCDTGYFLLSTVPLGVAWIGTDKVAVAKGTSADGGTDYIEIYSYNNGSCSLLESVYSEARTSASIRNARPMVDPNEKAMMWHRGYYNFSSFTDFNTDVKLKLLPQSGT